MVGHILISRLLRIYCLLISVMATSAFAQEESFRPPAVPLATCDPYFSVWSFSDHPADDWTRHWTGATQAISSIIRIDEKSYRICSKSISSLPLLPLYRVEVTPTRSIYFFSGGGIDLTFTFMTPLLPENLDLIARPITYVSWKLKSIDGKEHSVSLYFDASAELAVNMAEQHVTWSRVKVDGLDVLALGSQSQNILKTAGDNVRIDWGYFYLVSPREQNATHVMTGHQEARNSFVQIGTLPSSDDVRMPRAANDNWPVLSYSFDLGHVGTQPVERFLVMAYDDQYSIEYLHQWLQPYWKNNGMRTEDLLKTSVHEYRTLTSRCEKFDEEITADLQKVGGKKYAQLAVLSYRQAIAAHKLVADLDGTPLLFPKENFSNGCISTVDVIYPTAPIFLLFNLDLMKASLTPVLRYSALKRWRFPFAPHDLGTYPLANGQVYGGGEKNEEDQMPVEESGNMLLLVYAIARVEGTAHYASQYWLSLEKWAMYIREKGLDPENQLCTDDFAGHMAHNVNLSLKAILALGAYSKLCDMMGKSKEATEYWQIAERYAHKWEQMADDGDHYRLAFDKPGTWSQKYNLVWDKLLDLHLFSPEISQKEIRFYKTKQNQFGLPLDGREDYTKLDWTVWTASLAEEQDDFEFIISRVYDFANQTSDRVPLTDWYDTKTARKVGFQARSVVGGVFIKMLTENDIWKKWSSRSVK